MKRVTAITAFLAASAASLPAFADENVIWDDRYGHMSWGAGHSLFGGLLMLVFWAAVIGVIVFAVRWLSDRDAKQKKPNALDVLNERLARGDIEPEDYEARRKILES